MSEDSGFSWKKCRQFILHDVWTLDISSMSLIRRTGVSALRTVHLVVRGIKNDELLIRASALTFASLMSLIPLLAIIFSILRGFGVGQDRIDSFLEWKGDMPVEFQTFLDKMVEVVNNTDYTRLSWVGLAALLMAATWVLAGMEDAFNRIWGIARSRNIMRRTANYISILVVVPILIGIAGTFSATLQSETVIAKLGSVGILYRSLLRFTPAFSAWLAFIFLYLFLPNTRVRLMPAAVSALAGSLMWLTWQNTYITMQVGVARYNAIYGTFATVPIFLAWLYISWIIILLGAEVAFAIQNQDTYPMELTNAVPSIHSRSLLLLSIITSAGRAQKTQGGVFEVSAFARENRVPIRLVNKLVELLEEAGFLVEVADRGGCYVLCRAADGITVRDVFNVIAESGASPAMLGIENIDSSVAAVLERLGEGMDGILQGRTVEDLVEEQVT
ncbi:MAG: YihY family inner membrane protein [Verrucomicrobia bacterium]|nr:YihY family inner membrane protein [Verrucomicrobiota bacterium]